MYFVFLWEVLKRAFTPAPRVTDMLQILTASALPAATKFAGFRMPESASNDVLAYIGLVALSFVAIRLFWAPYAMWKEQGAEIGVLKLQLSRPERILMERLTKHRAKARARLAADLEDLQSLAYAEDWAQPYTELLAVRMQKIRRLEAESGLSDAYFTVRGRFLLLVQKEGKAPNDSLPLERTSSLFLKLLQRHAIGDITAEDLLTLSPPYTELEKQP